MTKVQIRFKLETELDEAALERISNAQSIYGVEWIRVEGAPATDLLVEYDATRLRLPELESALSKRGVAVAPIMKGRR